MAAMLEILYPLTGLVSAMTSGANNHNEIAAYESQAREFLAKSRKFLSAGDLRQAAEKGWDAAEHMAKAVALAQGWQYTRHSHFHRIMNQAEQATGNHRLSHLYSRAEILHHYYELKSELSATRIGRDIDLAALLEILYPLTGLDSANLE